MIVQDCRELRARLRSMRDVFAFDTETKEKVPDGRPSLKRGALQVDRADLEIFTAFGRTVQGEDVSVSVPVKEYYGKGYVSQAELASVIKPFFSDSTLLKIAHNLNYDWNVLLNLGVDIQEPYCCSLIAARMFDENAPAGLKDRATHIGMMLKDYKSSSAESLEDFCGYAEQDAEACYKLAMAYLGLSAENPELKLEASDMRLLFDLELPLLAEVVKMERRGVLIDIEQMSRIHDQIEEIRAQHEAEVFRLIGHPINLNSPKQLQKVLYDDFGIAPPDGSAGKTGFSTNVDALRAIGEDIPVVRELLGFRATEKLSKTVSPEIGIPASCDARNYVHTTYSTTGAQTFRFSSSMPNLQNIPSVKDTYSIRKCFIAPEGHMMNVCDYSMMELVMLANVCKDPVMLHVLTQNGDLHQMTADSISMKISGETGRLSRGIGKTLNFALIYGMASNSLSKVLTQQGYPTSPSVANDYIRAFYETYECIVKFKRKAIADYDRNGYVEYPSGRRRKIPNMESSAKKYRSYGERQLVNSIIQGGCADFVKYAILRLVSDDCLKRWRYRLLMQVHDEVGGIMPAFPDNNPRRCANRVGALLSQVPDTFTIDVIAPFKTESHIGSNWKDAK